MLSALLVAAVPSMLQDWPHWGGPDRNAVSQESDWSSVGASEPVWQKDVGLGYSCFTIVGDALYTAGHDQEAQLDHVLRLDALTGEEVWRHSITAETADTFHGGGTLATPIVVGDVVFASQRAGNAFAFSAEDGEVLWHRNFAEELELQPTTYGYSISPLSFEGALIYAFGGTVLRVEPETGDVKWRSEDYGDGGYANPAPLQFTGKPCITLLCGPGVVGIELESGTEIFRHTFATTGGATKASTPVVLDGGRVFASASRDAGSILLQLEEGQAPILLWRSRAMRNKISGCVPWDGHFYGFDEAMLKCIDMEGEEKWRVRGFGMGALSIAGGRLIVLDSRGNLLVAEATPDGFEELSRTQVLHGGGECWTTPVLVGGRIYCRSSRGELVCLDHRPAVVSDAPLAARTPQELPDARELYAAHVKSVGTEPFPGRFSRQVEGEIEITGLGITRTKMRISQGGEKWHLWYDLGEFGEVVRAYDGEIGWELDPFFGNRLIEGAELKWMSETLQQNRDLEWEALYPKLATEGPADFDGRRCWKVTAESKGGVERTLYFERESGRLAGTEGAEEPMAVYADYRPFDGLHLPTRVTFLRPGTGVEERYFVDEVSFDRVESMLFAHPDPVLRLLRTPEEIAAADAAAREAYAVYFGKYRADFPPYEGAEWEVTVQDGDLVVLMPDAPVFAIVPTGEPGHFAFAHSDKITLQFNRDSAGAVTGIDFNWQGEENHLPRVPVDPFLARLDEFVPELLYDFAVPGASVALIRGGEIAFVKGYGRRDEAGTPVEAGTVFSIGSISKTVAAWGVMKLVEEGALDLDTPVSEYLTRWSIPESEFDEDGVTVRRLLSHTAGLSLHGYMGFDSVEKLPTVEESLGGETNGSGPVTIVHEPGTKWQYSGGGYTLLQLLVEERSGRPFAEYLREEVFGPLGLERTDYKLPESLREHLSLPFSEWGEPVVHYRFTAEAAASLHTTAGALARFALAGLEGPEGAALGRGVLAPETVKAMQTPQSATRDTYGLGYQIADVSEGLRTVGHGGSNIGWRARFAIVPETGDGLVVLTNGSSGHWVYSGVFDAWFREVLGSTPTNPVLLPVGAVLTGAYLEGGADAALARYAEISAEGADAFDLGESQLRELGYRLRRRGDLDGAVKILEANAEHFPDSFAVHDNLGSAYSKQDQKERAEASFQRSLELNPEGKYAKRMLKRLELRE